MTIKENIGKGILVFVLVAMLSACDSFLDEVPDNRVDLNNLDKAAQVLTNAYSVASKGFTDWMTDDVDVTTGTNKRPEHDVFFWEDVEQGPDYQDTPGFYWYETYNAIAHANEVLNILEELPAETPEEIRRKDAIEAEARLARAYGHFMLVNLFGKPFNLQTSGSDPGVPYITEPEVNFIQQYERNSVRRVYENVEEDLLIGLEKIDDTFFETSGKYHFNRNAALAFASRFYLFRGDLLRCLEYSNQLLGADPAAFVRDMTSEEYLAAKSSIQGYPALFSSVDDPANLLLMRKISLVQIPSLGYGPVTTFYRDLFSDLNPFFNSTDEREEPSFVRGINAVLPVRYQLLFERSSLNSNVGLPYYIEPVFRGEEVLLNRIEAKILTSPPQIESALSDLRVFSERRYSGDIEVSMENYRIWLGVDNDPGFSDQLTLYNILLFERRKEFILQGMRWLDLNRLGIDISRESGMLLSVNDPRRVLQIPKSAVEVGGLEENPR